MRRPFDSLPFRFFVTGLILVTVIFVLELTLPTHPLITVGYVIVILCMLQFPQQRTYALILGFVSTVFMVVAYAVNTAYMEEVWSVPLDRALSVVAVWLVIYFDIRLRKLLKVEKANLELEKSQRLFKAIAHHFPDSVIGVLNPDLKYVFADGQELHNIGLTRRDSQGFLVFDNIHPALSREAEPKLRTVFQGARISYEALIGPLTYTVSSVPLPDERGRILEIMVVIKNITEQKKVEQDLMQSVAKQQELNDMKSKFVTMASHEFRTPLGTILSSVFLLENYTGEEFDKNKLNLFSKIKRSVNNLTDLLNDFMLLGKLEEGKMKVAYESIHVREFLEQLVPEMELVRKGNQTIHCECAGEVEEAWLDKQLLRSIIMNLIGNAIKYSSIESEIKVKTRLTENELVLEVMDHGIGIPPDEQKHIFKRFYRAQNAANIEGTGLGLNIVRKYVKLLKGRIEFQSKLNEGTIFRIVLPAGSLVPERIVQRQTQRL